MHNFSTVHASLECQSPLLNDFEAFFENFGVFLFGNSDEKIQQISCELFAKDHAQLLYMLSIHIINM
jgi:hypothetical protein